MNLTTFVDIGATTAFVVVGERADVYLADYPRSGDISNNGEWRHDNLSYMNGRKDLSTEHTGSRAMGSCSDNIIYCIESGTGQRVEDTLTEKDENFFNDISSNGTISGGDIRLFIGRILQYGYHGGISTSWRSQNESDANCIAHAYTTWILVWEMIIGERNVSFSHVSTRGYNTMFEHVGSAHPLYSKILSYYNNTVTSVQNHTKVPNFYARSGGFAKVNGLEWSGSKYAVILADTNDVSGNYNLLASIDGVSFPVNGNKLAISMGKAPSKELTITAAKKDDARRGAVVQSDGIHQSGNGIQDVATYAQEISDPVSSFVKMRVSCGSCQIVRANEDGEADDIQFTISGNGVNQTVIIINGDEFQLDNLTPGVYAVAEQSISKYVPQEAYRATVVAGQVTKANLNNVLRRGNLQVIKSSGGSLVEGVALHLYGTSLTGIAVDEYIVTDKSSVASFNDVLTGGITPYITEEMDTAIHYIVPANQIASINWEEATIRNFTNIPKKFGVTVTKSNRKGSTSQSDAILAGAVYSIYRGKALVGKYVMDRDRQSATKEYICDNDWTIREITPSKGYLLDDTIYKVDAEPQLYTVKHSQTADDITEQVMKGNIATIRHTDDGEARTEIPENGATSEIYLKSPGSFNSTGEDERDVTVCGENGFGQTKGMPYGVYTVHQTAGREGRELIRDFDVFIPQNGQTYRYPINSANFESYIKVVKVGTESGKDTPYAGVDFKIFDSDDNQVTMTFTYPTPIAINTLHININEQFVTPEKLGRGKEYPLVEVQAPYGYMLDNVSVCFNAAEEHSSNEGGITTIRVGKPNMAQKDTVSIKKTGKVFSEVNISGEENANVIYQSIYEVRGFAGVVHEITVVEGIITPDGILRYAEGEVVNIVTINEDGLAGSKELYLGRYTVAEITVPEGMVTNKEVHKVKLIYAGQEVSMTETATSFADDRQKITVSLEKTIEKNDIFNIGNGDEMKNISFRFLITEELVLVSGTSISVDGLIEIISFSENGKAIVETEVSFGNYYTKELVTDEHYILSDVKYLFTSSYVGQDTTNVGTVVNDGKTIENGLIYGSASGKKIAENNKALGGAVIGLFRADETGFTKENALMTATFESDGSPSFDKVSYGNQLVKETEQSEGFVFDKTSYRVRISEIGQITEVKIVNEYVYGNVKLIKVDEDYPNNKLMGAIFEVYKDINNDGKLDDGDEFIGTFNETSMGIHEVKEFFYGKYLIREAKTPEGFELDKSVYSVFIEKDEITYEAENKAGVGFTNMVVKGNLKIVKTSSDGKVEGFTLKVTRADDYNRTFTINKNDETTTEGLCIGDCAISEVQDSVSAFYALLMDKIAAVKVGSITAVEMHNELRDTPKTGDNSNVGLWVTLAGLSTLDIVDATVVVYRKKEKEDSE